jgi:hypothetical protein
LVEISGRNEASRMADAAAIRTDEDLRIGGKMEK